MNPWEHETTRQVAKRMNKSAFFLEVQNFCDVIRGQTRVNVSCIFWFYKQLLSEWQKNENINFWTVCYFQLNSLSSFVRKYFCTLFIASIVLILCIVILELVDFLVRIILLNP